jgi:hypothetical protein
VADDGLGVGVQVVGVVEAQPFIEEVAPSAFPVVPGEALRQVGAQRVDGDLQDQPGRLCGCRHRQGGEGQQQGRSQ